MVCILFLLGVILMVARGFVTSSVGLSIVGVVLVAAGLLWK